MIVVKNLKDGVAGDALPCSCRVRDGVSGDSESNEIVCMVGKHIPLCSLWDENVSPLLGEKLHLEDCGNQRSVGEDERIAAVDGGENARGVGERRGCGAGLKWRADEDACFDFVSSESKYYG